MSRLPVPRRLLTAVAVAALTLFGAFASTAAATPRGGQDAPASVGAPADSAGPAAREVGATATTRSISCAGAGRAAGWRGDQLVLAVAIALAESGCTPGATGYNGPTTGCPYGSADRGAWQINDCYHSDVSDACAYDLRCNADAAYRIYGWSGGFTPWTTYNTGAYQAYWSEAETGVNAPSGNNTYTVRTGDGTGYVNLRSGPGTGYSAVGRVQDADTVRISCYSLGTTHVGPWGSSNLWNRLTSGSWISDAFVYTGSAAPVVPRC
ncbi:MULTISPECIES: hypothetical protein [Streptomyces]|uniref:Transglycosylase SLT domain-containing protein n=1 Tax=Streptomyces pini TaxID=1520580 RepID=A0A1I4B4I8_9ACTN|nr:hypothetical protein [Streptomyces pini]SFK63067.1 hypothetical protein SAMN05192584_107232 [Streptomyces pini]